LNLLAQRSLAWWSAATVATGALALLTSGAGHGPAYGLDLLPFLVVGTGVLFLVALVLGVLDMSRNGVAWSSIGSVLIVSLVALLFVALEVS